ncbi:MAG: chorismate-binding protein [Actinomycetales bacterium]
MTGAVTGWSAWWAGQLARELVEEVDLATDPGALDRGGWWAVAIDFHYPQQHGGAIGRARAWRFGDVRAHPLPAASGFAPPRADWHSSLDRQAYIAGVRRIRELVRAGEVYQANLCRVLSVPAGAELVRQGPYPLAGLLAAGNPAPFAGVLNVPGLWLASASPELFLRREQEMLTSAPIKGTAVSADRLLAKDTAENVMITDLVRNDLQRVCRPGTVAVPSLLGVERHPGLVHLVSTITGRLRDGVGWGEILAALCPPGSVSGAPKHTALQAIRELEPVPRGPYCGAIGWVDADAGTAELAVGIRSFWIDTTEADPMLRFGTGAGITWGSDPQAEWAETELKADRLVRIASGHGALASAGGVLGE